MNRSSPGGKECVPELRSGMADVIFVVLTIAIFVVFGVVVKAVERL
jgi:hypothetical protein